MKQKSSLKQDKLSPSFDFENSALLRTNTQWVVGLDEAGCGPWAGPVVAGAVIFLDHDIPEDIKSFIRDSKTLSPQKREFVYNHFCNKQGSLLHFAHGQANVEEIEELNIVRASCLAMERAIAGLPLSAGYALVDGNRRPNLPCSFESIIKGDQRSYSIAAASIVAKVVRDRIMSQLDEAYPLYDWKNNAGYGTPKHQQALREFGPTPHHRKTYEPIRKFTALHAKEIENAYE